MSGIENHTISLPSEHSTFIDAKVASDACTSAGEVVRAGFLASQERRLRDEMAPAYDAMNADSRRGVFASKVFADIRVRHAQNLKAKA